MTWMKQPVSGENFSLKAKQDTFLAEQDIAISGWNGQPSLVVRHGVPPHTLCESRLLVLVLD
jgi:hypothetical protein